MKYKIDDIEKGKTIKSVQIVNSTKKGLENEKSEKIKVIMVNYLDGTQDVFEFNEETLNKIQEIVDKQAQAFVKDRKNRFPIEASLGFLLFVGIVSGIVCPAMISTNSLFAAVLGLASVTSLLGVLKLNSIRTSIEKHKIYVNKIMNKLQEYNEIVSKENEFVQVSSKDKLRKPIDIVNIDNKSIDELNYIGDKIERYNEIDGKKPKTKSL